MAEAKVKKQVSALDENATRAQQIKVEEEAMKNWSAKWGFLSTARSSESEMEMPQRYALGVPSKSSRLMPNFTMVELCKMDFQKLTRDEQKCLYHLSGRKSKFLESLGEMNDRYSAPPTSSSQIGWWIVDATRRLDTDRERPDASARNTLMDFYLRNHKP